MKSHSLCGSDRVAIFHGGTVFSGSTVHVCVLVISVGTVVPGVCVLLIDLAGDRRAVVRVNSVTAHHVNRILHNGCYCRAGGQSSMC